MGFAYHRWRSAKNPEPALPAVAVSTIVGDVESKDKSVAFGSGGSMQGSAIVYGHNNTFNFPPQPAESKPQKPTTAGEGHPKDWLIAAGVLLAFLLAIGAAVYFSSKDSPSTRKADPNPPTQQPTSAPTTTGGTAVKRQSPFSSGIQYGENISSISVDGIEYTACTEKGITCLGEGAISGKTISIPLQSGSNWSRIAVLISSTEYGEMARIVVSTQSAAVGLNYVDHRDGMFHNQIEFLRQYVDPISESQMPLWYPVDIIFRKPVESFPLTISVSDNDEPAHLVTTHLHVIRAPAAKTASLQ
jgi:hypothetical protein